MRMSVDLGRRFAIGQVPKGRRGVWVLTGGRVAGPLISGTVAPVGGEFELIDAGGAFHIDVRLVIVTDEGANIFLQYFGVAVTPPDVAERHRNGAQKDFGQSHFVTQPRFETGHSAYAWLNHTIAVAEGRPTATGVEYLIYRCIPDSAIGLANADRVFAARLHAEGKRP